MHAKSDISEEDFEKILDKLEDDGEINRVRAREMIRQFRYLKRVTVVKPVQSYDASWVK